MIGNGVAGSCRGALGRRARRCPDARRSRTPRESRRHRRSLRSSFKAGGLLPSFRQAPLLRAVVVVVLGIDLAHRLLARALFVRVRDQARQPRDQEDRVAKVVGEAEVGADRGDGAVDVDRQRAPEVLLARRRGRARRPGSAGRVRPRARARAPSERAARRADRACGTGGRTRAASRRCAMHSSTMLLGGLLQRLSAAHEREPAVEEPHARFDVAAVMRTERQHARRDAVLERRPGRGDVARGERRRRRDAVIERRHQDRR